MIFSKISYNALKSMGINAESFSLDITAKHGSKSHLFDKLLTTFCNSKFDDFSNSEFQNFIESCNQVDNDSLLYNSLYDIYNYLRLYSSGGKFFLFKNRQAEWGGPHVLLCKEDVPASDINDLPAFFIIYRGMSIEEFEQGKFAQSWTRSLEVARKFAFEIYVDEPRGVVAGGIISKESVIHYSSDDPEQEIITSYESIKRAKKIET